MKSISYKSFLGFATLSVLFGGVDSAKIYQDAATAVPFFQLVAFSTMAVNNGLQIAKQLGDSKEQVK
jgi:bacteriorhodopsin